MPKYPLFDCDGEIIGEGGPDSGLPITYYWLHVPTGETGSSKAYFLDRLAFLSCLSRWNAQDPYRWRYSERPFPIRASRIRSSQTGSILVSAGELRRLYKQSFSQLQRFLGYEPSTTDVVEYLSRRLLEEGKAKGSEESIGEEVAELLAASRDRGKRESAALRQPSRLSALHFREGDRVRMLGTDFYSGVQEGDTGTVDRVQGALGLSPYPDPAKRLVMVRWDKGGRVSVPRKMLERIPKRKADWFWPWMRKPSTIYPFQTEDDLDLLEEDPEPQEETRQVWSSRRRRTWDPIPPHDDEAPFDSRRRLEPQEHQPMEGGEDGPSQESRYGGFRHLRLRRLA
jgi:hypothetical protein